MNEDYKRGMCQCRSCNKVFHESERIRNEKECFGLHSVSTECPYCNSGDYGLMDYPIDEEKLIYKSKSFYRERNVTQYIKFQRYIYN